MKPSVQARRRYIAAALALALMVGGLTACTPSQEPRVGVALRDGVVNVVVAVCEGSALTDVRLDQLDTKVHWAVTDPDPEVVGAETVVEVPALAIPEGWGEAAQASTLTALAPGTEYYAGAGATGDDDLLGIPFTLADLDGVGAGILGRDGKSRKTMTAEEFLAAADCD